MVSACGGAPRVEEPKSVTPAPIVQTEAPEGASNGDAPQISRSRGVPGGIVVLWPRIVLPSTGPRSPDASLLALARSVQQRLAQDAARALTGRAVDVRPKPQRVCPRSGCVAVSVGALLTRAGSGCAALALVSPAGRSPARIVPWGGKVVVRNAVVPFREHPEGHVAVKDYVPCERLLEALARRDAEVESAIQSAAR